MATLTTPKPKHYDVLAEALLADGRVVKRVDEPERGQGYRQSMPEIVAQRIRRIRSGNPYCQ